MILKTRNFKFNRIHTGVNISFTFNHGFQYDLKVCRLVLMIRSS